ncbi:non-specific serine,threonine protein kinase, partial [Sarracenia purpurea var. burkii]
MVEVLLFQKMKKKKLILCSVLVMVISSFPLASPLNDEENQYYIYHLNAILMRVVFSAITGKALMSIKASFGNVANVLLDWDDLHNDDFCSWRGVFCDNVSLSVVS